LGFFEKGSLKFRNRCFGKLKRLTFTTFCQFLAYFKEINKRC
jgi:hypothetical protein